MTKDIKVLGIDLAKDVFQLHGTDAKGKKICESEVGKQLTITYRSIPRV